MTLNLEPKNFIKSWLPPAVLMMYRRLRRDGISYNGDYASWQEAEVSSTGYDSNAILEKVYFAITKVKSGEAVYERDSVLFDKVEHSFPLLAGLLRVATEDNGKLRVLDFGGSLGSTYFQCHHFLSGLPELYWGIVEQRQFVERGREFFETGQLRFFFSIQECVDAIHPNVIVLASVLQYIQKPFDLLKIFIDIDVEYIIIDRTQFSSLSRDWLTVQSVPPEIYSASYPCWIFSESYFESVMSEKFELIADFEALGGSGYASSGVSFSFKGMIWRRR